MPWPKERRAGVGKTVTAMGLTLLQELETLSRQHTKTTDQRPLARSELGKARRGARRRGKPSARRRSPARPHLHGRKTTHGTKTPNTLRPKRLDYLTTAPRSNLRTKSASGTTKPPPGENNETSGGKHTTCSGRANARTLKDRAHTALS